MKAFIDVDHINFKYDSGENSKDVLSDLTIQIKKGEFLAIVGHNGSGKSTLAKHFNAMLLPTGGKIFVSGIDTGEECSKYEIRRRVGLVLQNPDNQIVASVVEEDVAFAPENLGVPPKEIRKRVDEALKTVDMYDYRKSVTFKLSGGQKQRIAIAGIIAMLPDCIVLDEPTAMLDPKGRDEVLETIRYLNRERKITVILITHFMEEAIFADKIILMNKGKIALQGSPHEVFAQVELLKECKLSLPQCTQLIHALKARGLSLPCDVLNENECVAVLEQLLEGKKCR
ncbi:MAG: energy-coupling factor transporter ATPase [Oscillospiraceae bacterium]|jgi:energy-coupling factor transport system ATP-binding protein|nr:energy-coupling factor transporter ATPase [Oscillospiraceae bacterium]